MSGRRSSTVAAAGVLLVTVLAGNTTGRADADSVQSPPRLKPYSDLAGVAVLSPTDAWAVGVAGQDRRRTALTEHWDGSTWTVVPNPHGNGQTYLYGVAAVATDDVWAVGFSSKTGALTEHWDGTAWTRQRVDEWASALNAVSVVSADDVWAVGATATGFPTRTVVEHWDGTGWTQIESPSPGAGSHGSQLKGVVAISATDVWAVGDFEPSTGVSRPLALHWDGAHWKKVATPGGVSGVYDTGFSAVAAAAPDDVWAVGEHTEADQLLTLTEHWDGTAWRRVRNPVGPVADLRGVSMVAGDDVWAVGWSHSDRYQTLVLHWDGEHWSQTSSPGPRGRYGSLLLAVDADGPADAWAVGYGSPDKYFDTLAERWDGTSWELP